MRSDRLIGFLHDRASGRIVLGWFVVTMAVYLVMLGITIPRVQRFAPESTLFNLSPTGYSRQEALSLLESLGPEGRSAYLFPQLVLDFVYPGLFAVCFSLMFVWLYSRRFRPDSGFLYLALLPMLAGLFDYGENLLIIRMITEFPNVSRKLIAAANVFRMLKSAFSTASFLLLMVGFVLLLKKRSTGGPSFGNQS
ncbi:MAG: hypothetical protein R3F07_13990 [Opitutaceae bacterium]